MRSRLISTFWVIGLVVMGGDISKGVDESRTIFVQRQRGEDRDRGLGQEIPSGGRAPLGAQAQPRFSPGFFPPGRDRDRFRRQWRLGIFANDTATGAVVTRVVPGGPAARAGLETNDRILTVNGYQVGFVMQRWFPLGDELQRRAGPRGDVTLLVHNRRNNRLININVRMREEGSSLPIRPFGQEEGGDVETPDQTLRFSDEQAELSPPPEPSEPNEASEL